MTEFTSSTKLVLNFGLRKQAIGRILHTFSPEFGSSRWLLVSPFNLFISSLSLSLSWCCTSMHNNGRNETEHLKVAFLYDCSHNTESSMKLDNTFLLRWIRWRCSIDWPMDIFWGWGHSKEEVFVRNPYTADELKELISQAFVNIDANKELYAKMCYNVRDRLQECIKVDWGHFEHLRD